MQSTVKLDQLLFTLALIPLTALPVLADEEEIQSADDMVVTATRSSERSIDVPTTTQVITREQIEMSGMTDVADLIGKYATGHYHKYNGLLSPIGLRGFRTDGHGDDLSGSVLLLVDGHRVGTGNAAKISLDRIERVEIIKGPSSALYGSAAMGGVINMITKKGEGELGGSVNAEYGSFDYYKLSANAGGELNDKFRFFANTSLEDIGDYDDPTYGTVYNSGVEKKNIGANLLYTINNRHEIRLGGNYADLESESPDWNGDTYTSYSQTVSDYNDKSTGYADLEYNGDYFDNKVHWKALVYYLYDKNLWNTGTSYGYATAEASQTKYVDTTLGTDQQFSWKMTSWNTLTTGFTLENLEKESSGYSNYQPSTPYTPGLDYDNQAGFLQDSLDLLDNRVNLIGALRYDRFDVTTEQPETGSYEDFNGRSEDYSHISPKLGVGVKFLDEMLRLRANAGEGFKSPTANQLSADYYHSTYDTHYLGNPDLDPETSMTYDVGMDLYLDTLTFSLGWFHTDYEDKINQTTALVAGETVTTWDNLGDAEISGFEVTLDWALGKTFQLPFDARLFSNMTFNTNKENEETGEDMTFISDYEIKSGLDMGYQGFKAELSHVLVGPQMILNYDVYLSDTGDYQHEEKSSFDYWDLTMRYKFDEHWEAKASVLNLFDQEVEWVRGYLMAERNYRVGLTYHF